MSDFDRMFGSAKLNLGMDKRTMFYSALLLGMNHIFDVPHVSRAATDGPNLYLNKEWFAGITLPEAIGVIAHEVNHVLQEHCTRGLDLNDKIFNYACDYLINNELDDAGIELPDPKLMDHKYDGWELLAIYDDLLKDEADFPEITLDILPPASGTETQIKTQIDMIISQAVTITKMGGGTVPAVAERYIEELAHPKIQWDQALAEFAQELAAKDYTWERFNRSYFPKFILPGMGGNNMDEIAFALDSSGSVSNTEFNSFRAAIQNCREIMEPTKTTIVDFTTQINNVYELDQFEEMRDLTFDGWGGTDLHPVIEFFKDRNPTVLVVFSDLDCCPIEIPPDYPIVWVCINAPYQTVNFGKLIHYSTHDL